MYRTLGLVVLVIAFTGIPASAGLIVGHYANSYTVNSSPFYGQGVTTPSSGGPWTNIEFNWLDIGGNPQAHGSMYILTGSYIGSPEDLSSLTPGYLASTSTIIDGVYKFAPSVTLTPDTQYHFYMGAFMDGALPPPTPVYRTSGNSYNGGLAWGQLYPNTAPSARYYGRGTSDMGFELSAGSAPAVPEPSSAILLALAAGVGAVVYRRKRKALELQPAPDAAA